MLNSLIPLFQRLRASNPRLYYFAVRIARRFLAKRLGIYPRVLGREVAAVTEVLHSTQWNMAYGRGLVHERLEAEFAEFVGVPNAVAVGTGGMALQMSMRALGIRPGDEVIHQIDTCAATAMAVMNAGASPVFSDISDETFMLSPESVREHASGATRALIATHMWGNPENMVALRAQADAAGWKLIEDACLSLGAVAQGRAAGAWGDVAVFSFGCIKPIQGGEGGMIVTSDQELARELRAMRNWGDRTIDYGVRDVTQLAWNGRMSEIVAAVVREQLRGYPRHLALLREAVEEFAGHFQRFPGVRLGFGTATSSQECAFSQVVLKLEESSSVSKQALWNALVGRGVHVWHGNFEPINSLSLFTRGHWRDWILRGDLERLERNYSGRFPNAERAYRATGLGLSKVNFLSSGNIRHLQSSLDAVLPR